MMHHRFLGLGALTLSVLPILALACGDSDSGAAPSPVGPDASDSGVVENDGSTNPDASPPAPITVTVRLAALKIPSAYVVFYPKDSPESPIFELVADGQSVSKSMPGGAHIVFVAAMEGASSVLQVDDVGPGETVDFDASRGAGEPLELRRLIPEYGMQENLNYVFVGCQSVDYNATADDAPTMGKYDPLCVEAGNKVRFLALAAPSGNATPRAIAASVVDLATAGTPPLAAIGSWATPTPTTWSFSGSSPGAAEYFATVFATNSATFGGFNLQAAVDITDQGVGTATFLRPPAGFNDSELHWAAARFPTGTNDGSENSAVFLVDRTSPTAALATDFSTAGPHFSAAPQVTADGGSASFTIQTSAAFPSGTTFVMTAVRFVSEMVGASWSTITTRSEQNKIAGLHLPDVVRQAVGDVDWSQSNMVQARAITGIDAAVWTAAPLGAVNAFAFASGIPHGFPSGNFQAKVASYDRRTD